MLYFTEVSLISV